MKDVLHQRVRDALRRMGNMNGLDAKIEVVDRIAGFITQGLGWVVDHVERDMERRSKRKRSERTKPGMEDDDSEGMMATCNQSREAKPEMKDDLEGMMPNHSYGRSQSFSPTVWDSMGRPIPYISLCSHKPNLLSRDSFPVEVCENDGKGATIVTLHACSSSSWMKDVKMIILILFIMMSCFLPLNMVRRKLRTRRNDKRLANALLESKMHPREREILKSQYRESMFPKRELFTAQCHCGKLSCSVKLSR